MELTVHDIDAVSIHFQEELLLDHEPSFDHWAKLIAEGEVEDGATNYDYEYEQAWHSLDAEFNYNYEYREIV
jgi:hypothetical protein